MNLVIDIGNTQTKLGLFSDGIQLAGEYAFSQLDEVISKHHPERIIVSSVKSKEETHHMFNDWKEKQEIHFLSSSSLFPFINDYLTPHTLGMDRAAAVSGAMALFPNTNCLVIDAGTCITYDFVGSNKHYHGGSISPGLQMRFKALHVFTAVLPQVAFTEPEVFIGNTTETSILTGVFWGIVSEINGMMDFYSQKHGSVQVLLCGGDSSFFAKHIKNSIFAAPNLVLTGLNKLAEINVT